MSRKQQHRTNSGKTKPNNKAASAQKAGSNTLRIVAGQWRGRKLSFPDQQGLRPTPDRVRETLFNWLQGKVEASHCLDLFTGSGALALEALSRGASQATLIDSSNLVIKQLAENLKILGAQNAQLKHSSAITWLEQSQSGTERFDLVFMDPPFRQGLIDSCSLLLEQSSVLSPGAVIYIEAEKELNPLPIPDNWTIIKQKNSGQVSSYLCQRSPESSGQSSDTE